MKAELRIAIKDNRRSKTLKLLLRRAPFSGKQSFVRNERSTLAQGWPAHTHPGLREDQALRLVGRLENDSPSPLGRGPG
jgi:hypothetical protein